VTAPTSESYRENRRWRRRGKRKTMRIAAEAAHTFSCLCFPFLQMKNGEIMDEPKIIKNDSLISSFSSSAGQNEKHMEKNSDGVGGRRAEIVSRYFVLGFFFITVLAESASYRRYFLLLTGKAVCTTDDAAIISLSPSVSNINSHFLFFHFSCRHIFSNLVCVCVWILNWFAAG
jgi:hypothetical protein